MPVFELVIFDCDGVLVDSELITNRIFAQMLNELGLGVTIDDMFELFVGHSTDYCLEIITGMLGRKPPAGFVDEYRIRRDVALKSQLKGVPGIVNALDSIQLPYCVASSGDHGKMRTTLGITELLPRFEGRLFSVTEVARDKPAPDVFLYAAEKFGIEPGACLVVEDTPTGVAAGVAAGMTVCGYAALTPAKRLLSAGAHYIFNNMTDLPDLIREAHRASHGKTLLRTLSHES
jgi:HAD superfamily hydrolase (TIGR01509 family)